MSRDTVTKTDMPLIVSLARQAGETFCELYLLTGHGRPVFPIARNPMRKPHRLPSSPFDTAPDSFGSVLLVEP